MWFEIVLSLFAGCYVGATYSNKLRPFLEYCIPSLKRKRAETGMPAIYSVPHSCAEDTCGPMLLGGDMRSTPAQPQQSPFEKQVEEYEKEHNSRLVFVNHGRQKNSAYGIDFNFLGTNDTICKKDAQSILDILREIPDSTDIDLILHTTGGSMAAAEVMVKALLAHDGRVRVHIPYYAESAGTMLALTGHEIHIGKGGWLTQVDPQLGYFSAASLLEYTTDGERTWFSDLASLSKVGAQKAMDRASELMNYISARRDRDDQAKHLNQLLVQGLSNHDKPLTEDLLDGIPGLSYGVSDEIMKLYNAHCDRR